MRKADKLFREYEVYHKDPRNKLTHYVGIPMIVIAITGLLSLVTIADTSVVRVDLAIPVLAATVLFYMSLDVALGLGALVILAGFAALVRQVPLSIVPAAIFHVGLFVLGWILQFVGHYFEGRKPAFLTNFVHLLVGPLWILSHLYEKVGLRSRPVTTTGSP